MLACAFAPAGCGFPAPEACALACGDEGACPDGFECQAESQRCVPRGRSALCPLREQYPAQPAPFTDAGTGGAGPDVVAGAGGAGGRPDAGMGGGVPSAGSSAGGAGGGDSNPPAAGPLAIEVSAPGRPSCTGSELGLVLRASAGIGPFHWRITQAPAGVELVEASGDEFEPTGVPTEPGSLLVELEDASGAIARSDEFIVHERPQIVTPRMPAICSGEPYAMQLAAAGGQPDEYVWSGAAVDASGLPATLDELGLAIAGTTFSGELGLSPSRAPLQLTLALHDAHCEAESVELELAVVASNSDECPVIGVANGPVIDALPPACLGNDYSESLSADGGEPPFAWRALSLPPGLSFDAASATIHGVAQGDGVVAVELTDQSARTIQKSYAVVARDKCWLAYVASEPTPARLQMVDGRLLERQPATARRTFPGGASTDGVVDFEFSPDGRLLAYRFGSDAGSLRLGLVRLSDGQEQLQDLGGAVTAYAWAPDAQSLAVAFTANNQDLLGGVDVSAVDRTRVTPGGRLEGTRQLASRVVPSIDSTLVGYAGDRLAFLSRDAGSLRRRLRTTARDATGFAPTAPPPPGDFSDAARLLASAGGVFVTEPETASLAFFPSDGRPPVLHGAGAVPSPAGSFVGVARDAALQLFRAFEPSAPPAPPVLAASGCTAVLAWASERERIACVAERDGPSPIAVFDVRAGGSRLAPLTPMAESLVFPVGAHEGHRRVMSARGGWLGVTSDAELIISQLDTDAARLWAVLPTTALGTRPGALLFSPDEAALLIGAGNSLTLLDLEDAARPGAVLSNSALVEDACSERFADGADAWCGSALQGPVLAWSSASDMVSFRSALGTLSVIDVSLVRQGVVGPTLSPDGDCSEACRSSQTARFQP